MGNNRDSDGTGSRVGAAGTPDGIIGCDLTLLLPDGSQAGFSGDGAIEHALDGQAALVGTARSECANPVMLHVSGTTGPPQIVSASLNKEAGPTLRPEHARLVQSLPHAAFRPARGGARDALAVYEVHGRLVRNSVTGRFEASRHEVTWDGCDSGGRVVASRVYVCRLTAKQGVLTRRMVLAR